ELPQLAVGFVEEHELLLRIEDGDGRGDAVEGAIVGNRLALELSLRLLDRHDVDGRGRRSVLERQYGHVVRLALAADDEGKAPAVAFTARQHARRGPALALLQQLDLALLHLGAAARLDGPHVGVVDPGEAAVLAAQPNGDGKRVEQRAAGAHLACEALVLGVNASDLVTMPGHVAETEYGATAGRAPLGFKVTAGHGAHDEVERVSRGE